MVVLIVFLLAAIPAMAILFGIAWGRRLPLGGDEGSDLALLVRRWDAAVNGLRSAELEWSLGSLAEEDHVWVRQHYLHEAAVVMKELEIEEHEEEQILTRIEQEVLRVRERVFPPTASNGDHQAGGEVEASNPIRSQDE